MPGFTRVCRNWCSYLWMRIFLSFLSVIWACVLQYEHAHIISFTLSLSCLLSPLNISLFIFASWKESWQCNRLTNTMLTTMKTLSHELHRVLISFNSLMSTSHELHQHFNLPTCSSLWTASEWTCESVSEGGRVESHDQIIKMLETCASFRSIFMHPDNLHSKRAWVHKCEVFFQRGWCLI